MARRGEEREARRRLALALLDAVGASLAGRPEELETLAAQVQLRALNRADEAERRCRR